MKGKKDKTNMLEKRINREKTEKRNAYDDTDKK